jgi:hypothetical protein
MNWLLEFIRKWRRSRPKASEPKKSSPAGKPLRKQIVIGLDFGTSGTKAVVRDLATNTAELFDWEHRLSDFPSFVLPSSVSIRQGKMFFGATAEKLSNSCAVLRSFKICLACGAGIVTCRGCNTKSTSTATFIIEDMGKSFSVTARQVSTAFLGFAIGRIKEALRARYGQASTIDTWVNIGVPIDQENELAGRREFTSVAFWADKLSDSVYDGVPFAQFEGDYARITNDWANIPDEKERRVFLYPETAVALMSFLRSPVARAGLFALVDVGAGTTDVSFCRLEHAPQVTSYGLGSTVINEITDTMAFYEAKTHAVGSDDVDEALARAIAAKSLLKMTPGLIRSAKWAKEKLGSQRDVIAHHQGREYSLTPDDVSKHLAATISAMLTVYKETNFTAHRKEAIPNRWKHYSLLLLGGGARLRYVQEAFQHCRPSHYNRQIELLRPACPRDLKCSNSAQAQFDLLAIAYGLSFSPLDYPRLFRPAEVEPLRSFGGTQVKKRPDRDELYPK